MSKKGMIGLLVLMVMGLPLALGATSTGTVTLTVTVAPAAEIEVWYQDVGVTTYDFGSGLGTDNTSVSIASITVKNASNGLTEDWYIRASDAVGTSQNWNLADAAGNAAYELRAILNGDTKPDPTDFTDNVDELENGNQAMTGSVFYGDESGADVTSNALRGLWFYINTPTELTDTSQHTIWVTIVAAQGS